ncbi:hypothetical protein A2U01_0031287, partial [Trifolium medium]|nr:hypothetical protein [Trifolium medium]
MGDKERTIRVDKDERDWCCKIDLRSKSETSPRTNSWKMEVDLEELEEEMSQLKVKSPREEENIVPDLSDQLDMLTIKEENKALWVKRWGKNRKVATRSKFG